MFSLIPSSPGVLWFYQFPLLPAQTCLAEFVLQNLSGIIYLPPNLMLSYQMRKLSHFLLQPSSSVTHRSQKAIPFLEVLTDVYGDLFSIISLWIFWHFLVLLLPANRITVNSLLAGLLQTSISSFYYIQMATSNQTASPAQMLTQTSLFQRYWHPFGTQRRLHVAERWCLVAFSVGPTCHGALSQGAALSGICETASLVFKVNSKNVAIRWLFMLLTGFQTALGCFMN